LIWLQTYLLAWEKTWQRSGHRLGAFGKTVFLRRPLWDWDGCGVEHHHGAQTPQAGGPV